MRHVKQDPFIPYVLGLGFHDPVAIPTRKSHIIRGFKYSGFDPEQTRAVLGKAKKHNAHGKFVFVLARDRAVRVDTAAQIVLLGDGQRVVKAFLESI